MGPPREHGGMWPEAIASLRSVVASMGPPREHGGMVHEHEPLAYLAKLQWGRRVNTAECRGPSPLGRKHCSASMGPPREHGGMWEGLSSTLIDNVLQWGRRVNTAECHQSARRQRSHSRGFNGAAA